MKKRPSKRPLDPVLANVIHALAPFSNKQLSGLSNNLVGAQTIYNWRKGKVRRPLNYTLDAALRAAGYHRPIVKLKEPRK